MFRFWTKKRNKYNVFTFIYGKAWSANKVLDLPVIQKHIAPICIDQNYVLVDAGMPVKTGTHFYCPDFQSLMVVGDVSMPLVSGKHFYAKKIMAEMHSASVNALSVGQAFLPPASESLDITDFAGANSDMFSAFKLSACKIYEVHNLITDFSHLQKKSHIIPVFG